MAREFHIASLVVSAHPERAAKIAEILRAMIGAEIHAEAHGKFVVTLEAESDGDIADRFTAVSRIDGVLSAAPVSHYVEPLEDPHAVPS